MRGPVSLPYHIGGSGCGFEMALKPLQREAGRRFQCPSFLEEMGGAGDNGQFLLCPQSGESLLIQTNHHIV